MQETCRLPSSILHTNYVQLGQQLTVRQVQKSILQELEFGSVKCGNINTSWSSFVSLSVRVSAHKLGVKLKMVFVSIPDLGCILAS